MSAINANGTINYTAEVTSTYDDLAETPYNGPVTAATIDLHDVARWADENFDYVESARVMYGKLFVMCFNTSGAFEVWIADDHLHFYANTTGINVCTTDDDYIRLLDELALWAS